MPETICYEKNPIWIAVLEWEKPYQYNVSRKINHLEYSFDNNDKMVT